MHERILIVSDEQRNAWMREALAQEHFSVTVAEDANDGYEKLNESRFDLIIVNLNRSNYAVSLIRRIRTSPEVRRVSILTIAEWGTGQPTMALTEGADGFEPEPVDRERLIAAVAGLMRSNLTMIARATGADAEQY
jgi:DNA-binding response OmpR family regulator